MIQPKLPRTRRSAGAKSKIGGLSHKVQVELESFDVVEGGVVENYPLGGERPFGGTVVERSESSLEDVADDDQEVVSFYSYYEIIWTTIAIVSYVVDVGSDIYVAVIYYADEEWWWFGLTVTFIVVPSLTISAFSFVWYLQDKHLPVVSNPVRWIPRLVLVFLQAGPLIRYVDTVVFGLKCKWEKLEDDKRKWFRHKTWEETDSALLRLLECFMEAAPQLTLQLYIIAVQGIKEHFWLGVGQIVSCVSSLCSISWAMAAYQRALRASLDDKAKLGYVQLSLMFTWRLFTVGARVIALALFASCYGWLMFVVVGVHCLAMFIWILVQKTKFCHTKCEELFFNVVAAVINIFDFLNLVEGHTRIRYIIFYCIVYAENCAMIGLYYAVNSMPGQWYVLASLVAVVGLFFVGILLQVFYYGVCHPNNDPKNNKQPIKLCLSWHELINYRHSSCTSV